MLTPAQLSTLKAAILADTTMNAYPMSSDGYYDLASYLSLTITTPAFRVWRTNVPTKDVKASIVWTEYIARSDGEARAFELMISNGTLDASNINVRQGIQDCFSGPTGVGTRTALTNIAKRTATLVEKIFATGPGTEATPATMGHEGPVGALDVELARTS